MTAQAKAAAWTAAGAAVALAAVAVAAVAVAAQSEAGARQGAEVQNGAGGQAGDAGAWRSGGEGAAAAAAGRPDPDIVMPSKSSRPGCEVNDACYVPAVAFVSAGGSVTWQNGDVAFHTVTSGEYGSADGMFDSGHLDPGESYTVQFAEAGAVKYHCTLHPWMHGRVVVSATAGDAAGAASAGSEE